MPAACLRSWCASFTTALPFSSSSPTLSRPTPGCGRSSTSRTYTDPRCAKPTSSRASQSTLAPPSSTSTGCTAVGNSAPIAVDGALRLERGLDVAGPPHELDPEGGGKLAQRLHRALDFHARRVVPAHGIQRDANHR